MDSAEQTLRTDRPREFFFCPKISSHIYAGFLPEIGFTCLALAARMHDHCLMRTLGD